MTLAVREVAGAAEARLFRRLPVMLGGEAAGWSVPLDYELRQFLNPDFNGALRDWDLGCFLAWREGRPVGRICASWPRAGQPGGIGNFGFLALERDAAVLAALLRAAGAWLAARGARRLRGPFSFTINHESGVQVAGFERPPIIHMPRNPPWLGALLEGAGLAAEKDLVNCTVTLAEERATRRMARMLARWPGAADLRFRRLDRRRFAAEIRLVTELFNDAWAENWGALPVTPAEAVTIARLMRPMLLAGEVFFAEWQGRPIGVASIIPNLDEATQGLKGRLLPLGWWRVARLLLAGRCRAGRLPLLGISRQYRHHPASAFASTGLLTEVLGHARARGWERVEMGWLLEDNLPALNFFDTLPAPVTGRWRLYGAPLDAAA